MKRLTVQQLVAFLHDARALVEENLVLLLTLAALAVVVFWVTRPRVH